MAAFAVRIHQLPYDGRGPRGRQSIPSRINAPTLAASRAVSGSRCGSVAGRRRIAHARVGLVQRVARKLVSRRMRTFRRNVRRSNATSERLKWRQSVSGKMTRPLEVEAQRLFTCLHQGGPDRSGSGRKGLTCDKQAVRVASLTRVARSRLVPLHHVAKSPSQARDRASPERANGTKAPASQFRCRE
jgi:hypothetical protein